MDPSPDDPTVVGWKPPTVPPLPPNPPRPARPWWKRKWGIAAIVFAVLLIIGGVSNALDPRSAASSSPSPTSAALFVSASPGETPRITPSATATAQPIDATTPEPTDQPTAKPTPIPAILKTSGRGDKVVKFAVQDAPVFAKITEKGSSNFTVISYADTTYGDLLVNEIGSFSGTVYVAPVINRLKVTSNGSWTIEIRPIESARSWDGTAALTGKGDGVVLLTGGAGGITTIKNKSSSNFAVIAYSPEGDYLDLLVNEIGSYSGEVILPDADPMVLSIQAVGGTWSMSPVGQ